MAPPKKPKAAKAQTDDSQEIYIRWARAYNICQDSIVAARGIGIEESQIPGFLDMAKYCVEAQKIISEEVIFVPDFNSPEKLREAILKQLWMEARNSSTASGAAARVAALRAIGDIGGIVNPEEGKAAANTGGMLLVPVMKMDAWEKACEKAQAALRAAVHE